LIFINRCVAKYLFWKNRATFTNLTRTGTSTKQPITGEKASPTVYSKDSDC